MDVRFANFVVSIVALVLYISLGCSDKITAIIPFAGMVLCLITLKSGILETLESLVLIAWMISMAVSGETYMDPLFYPLIVAYVVHAAVLGGYACGIFAFACSILLLWLSDKTLVKP